MMFTHSDIRRYPTLLIVSILISFVIEEASALAGCNSEETTGVQRLEQFGYFPPGYNVNNDLTSCSETIIENATRCYQQFYSLTETGNLTDILSHITLPRCGCPDEPNCDYFSSSTRKRRYVLNWFAWQNMDTTGGVLTWTIQSVNNGGGAGTWMLGLADAIAITETQRAFDVWAAVLPGLTFQYTPSAPADIEIFGDVDQSTTSGHHWFYDLLTRLDTGGSAHHFCSGSGGGPAPDPSTCTVLAHAYAPGNVLNKESILGDIHQNNKYSWQQGCGTPHGGSTYNYYQVLLHEIGHALGLRHTDQVNCIMLAVIGTCDENHPLCPDDIAGVQAAFSNVTLPDVATTTVPPTTVVKTFPENGCAYKCTDGVKGTSSDCSTVAHYIDCQDACYNNPACRPNGFSWKNGECCMETAATVNTVQHLSGWLYCTAVCDSCVLD